MLAGYFCSYSWEYASTRLPFCIKCTIVLWTKHNWSLLSQLAQQRSEPPGWRCVGYFYEFLVSIGVSKFDEHHGYLSSVSLRLQRVYPNTWLLWYQRQMDLDLMLPSIIFLRTVNWEKWTKLFTNLLALVLAYSLFLLTAVTYIPLHISFTLREHYFAYILLLHHRAHIISHTSLQLHHHVLNKTYVNYITTS